jgi:hypothetical protein
MGHVASMAEIQYACRIMVRKPEGKIALGRLGHKWEVNIKMVLQETGYEDVKWMHPAQW